MPTDLHPYVNRATVDTITEEERKALDELAHEMSLAMVRMVLESDALATLHEAQRLPASHLVLLDAAVGAGVVAAKSLGMTLDEWLQRCMHMHARVETSQARVELH
jgi:hypothetical protein